MLMGVYLSGCALKQLAINWYIVSALVFGCGGDIALLKKDEKHVVAGIALFLSGHLCYIIAFVPSVSFQGIRTVAGIGCYLLYAGIVIHRLWPHVPQKLKVPVCLYIGVIWAMSVLAYLRAPVITGAAYAYAWTGSLFFFVSDTILAFQIFAKGSHHGVMITYLLAETLIVLGFLA